MICGIIRNLHSDRGSITEARAIDSHPMHDDGDFARQRHLGLLRLASCRAALAGLRQELAVASRHSDAGLGSAAFGERLRPR
jgi:hypothetical protein